MKKIVKLFGIMTIAAALLVSCKPAEDPVDNSTASDTGTTTEQNKETESDSTEKGNENDEIADYNVDLSKAEHILADWAKGWGEATNKIEYKDEKLIISCGNAWANAVEIAINKDLSKYSKVTIKGFVDADWAEDGDIKLEMYSSDEAGSELSKSYGDKTFLDFNTESKKTTMDLASAGKLYGDNYTANADLSNITKIKINPQGGEGTLTIESIVFSE